MWFAEVKAKAKRKNQILFSKDSLLLTDLRQLIVHANRRALILWALELGLDGCRELIEQRVMHYEQRLRYWMEYEKTCQQNWAGFLKE